MTNCESRENPSRRLSAHRPFRHDRDFRAFSATALAPTRVQGRNRSFRVAIWCVGGLKESYRRGRRSPFVRSP